MRSPPAISTSGRTRSSRRSRSGSYEDTAVLRYKSHIEVRTVGEGRLSHGAWHTCLYENHDGHWQVVWEQTTAVGAFPPPD